MKKHLSSIASWALAIALMAGLSSPAAAGSTYYVMAGYANPQQIAGPYDDLVSCNQAASGYNLRNASSAFHCVYKYSLGASLQQQSHPATYGGYTSQTQYNVVYHAQTHDRIVSSGYSSYTACIIEANSYNTANADYRYGCVIALP